MYQLCYVFKFLLTRLSLGKKIEGHFIFLCESEDEYLNNMVAFFIIVFESKISS